MFGSDSYHPLSPNGLAMTGGALGLIGWVVGLIWHGFMNQPSLAKVLYNLPYLDISLQVILFIFLVLGGALCGWLLATIYNWSIKKK